MRESRAKSGGREGEERGRREREREGEREGRGARERGKARAGRGRLKCGRCCRYARAFVDVCDFEFWRQNGFFDFLVFRVSRSARPPTLVTTGTWSCAYLVGQSRSGMHARCGRPLETLYVREDSIRSDTIDQSTGKSDLRTHLHLQASSLQHVRVKGRANCERMSIDRSIRWWGGRTYV